MITSSSRAQAAARAFEWLFQGAIPYWLKHGVDWARGGFLESLTGDANASPATFKRLRVLTRQIYVFAEGARRRVKGAEQAVDHGLAFLLGPMRHPEGGFIASIDLEGRPLDRTRDLYDLAFTLFALAHAYRLGGDPAIKNEARVLLRFIESTMKCPAGGFSESIPNRLPRRQNPHMHLLEAGLACAEFIQGGDFEELCDKIVDVSLRRFIDRSTGVLFEYYDEDLMPIRDRNGHGLVEPGHHFEWVWLLSEYSRVRGRCVAGGAELATFALRYGLDRDTGLLLGELYETGAVASAGVRLWPHCEWLKAALVHESAAGDPLDAWGALERFLNVPTVGLYHERWDPELSTFLSGPSPASTLYHITAAMVALAEHTELTP